jgi:hypothetical protein
VQGACGPREGRVGRCWGREERWFCGQRYVSHEVEGRVRKRKRREKEETEEKGRVGNKSEGSAGGTCDGVPPPSATGRTHLQKQKQNKKFKSH